VCLAANAVALDKIALGPTDVPVGFWRFCEECSGKGTEQRQLSQNRLICEKLIASKVQSNLSVFSWTPDAPELN